MLDLITPRETVVITTRGTVNLFGKEQHKENAAPVDWHMPVSLHQFAISVLTKSLTAELIKESGVFVVNFMSSSSAEIVKNIGNTSGHAVNKIEKYGFLIVDAEGVDCFRLKNAVGYLSCHVESASDKEEYTLFIGKVIAARELQHGVKRLFHKKNDVFTSTIL